MTDWLEIIGEALFKLIVALSYLWLLDRVASIGYKLDAMIEAYNKWAEEQNKKP